LLIEAGVERGLDSDVRRATLFPRKIEGGGEQILGQNDVSDGRDVGAMGVRGRRAFIARAGAGVNRK